MRHSTPQEKYDKLVDILIDSEYRMTWYTDEEILMEVFDEVELSKLITVVRVNLIEDFYFKIEYICDTSYLVYIYLKDETNK